MNQIESPELFTSSRSLLHTPPLSALQSDDDCLLRSSETNAHQVTAGVQQCPQLRPPEVAALAYLPSAITRP